MRTNALRNMPAASSLLIVAAALRLKKMKRGRHSHRTTFTCDRGTAVGRGGDRSDGLNASRNDSCEKIYGEDHQMNATLQHGRLSGAEGQRSYNQCQEQ